MNKSTLISTAISVAAGFVGASLLQNIPVVSTARAADAPSSIEQYMVVECGGAGRPLLQGTQQTLAQYAPQGWKVRSMSDGIVILYK